MQEYDFQSIAAQLRNPQGENGIKTAIRMSENNAYMIEKCIDTLHLNEDDNLLELGFGGGLHIPYLFQQQANIQYQGVDISETMLQMASEHNATILSTGKATLQCITPEDGYVKLPFEDHYFDRIFTVNTIYFWDNAIEQAKELLRVLKPGGQLAISFADKTFMEQLPFTAYNFRLYSSEAAIALFRAIGCKEVTLSNYTEIVTNTVNGDIEREFMVLNARKQ